MTTNYDVMQFIPKRNYYKEEEIRILKSTLSDYIISDVIEIIMIYYCYYIVPCDGVSLEKFWLKFGADSCNLELWCDACLILLKHGWRDTTLTKTLASIYGCFENIQNTLADILCDSYPDDIHHISNNMPLISWGGDNDNFIKRSIGSIFYSSHTFTKFIKPRYSKPRGHKTMSSIEWKYVSILAARINDFLSFLEEVFCIYWYEKIHMKLSKNLKHYEILQIQIKKMKPMLFEFQEIIKNIVILDD